MDKNAVHSHNKKEQTLHSHAESCMEAYTLTHVNRQPMGICLKFVQFSGEAGG